MIGFLSGFLKGCGFLAQAFLNGSSFQRDFVSQAILHLKGDIILNTSRKNGIEPRVGGIIMAFNALFQGLRTPMPTSIIVTFCWPKSNQKAFGL
jgi:hypothetical protein